MKAKAPAKILRLVKRRHFLFCLLAYPMLYAVCRLLAGSSLPPLAERYPAFYGFGVFCICAILVIRTVLEVISRLFKHELQGGKLKLRAEEGVQIEEIGEMDS